MYSDLKEIKKIYGERKDEIAKRLREFKRIWKKETDQQIFIELVFCLLTPQSKAKACWRSVKLLLKRDLLLKGSAAQLAAKLRYVRFRNNKARYIVEARILFIGKDKVTIRQILNGFDSVIEKRDWLVKNVKGLGYKEASHFLRNIGFGKQIAILDRHILKNLKNHGVIKDLPKTLTGKRYFEIEKRMAGFSKMIKIPLDYLDLILWCKETGEMFK